jgi:glycosyltransferase involved in cell wall biosynthesis
MLSELVVQMKECGEHQFEIVVRDDSQTRETEELFLSFMEKNKISYKYFHGPKMGVDAANIFLIENVDGKYLWLFSDDDEFLPGAIRAVGKLLEDESLNYIWANFLIFGVNNTALESTNHYFKDHNDAFKTIGPNFGLTSTHIIRSSLAKESLVIAREFIWGFSFAGVIPALYALSKPGSSYILGQPYILNYPTTITEIKDNTMKDGVYSENQGFYIHGILFNKTMMRFKKSFSRPAMRSVLGKNFSSLWRGMLVGWIGGWDSPSGKRWPMLKYYWSYPECWVALPLLCLPRLMNVSLYRFYKIFFANRRLKFLG